MPFVCPSCDDPPDAGATLGAACHACGATLVRVDDRDPLLGTVLDARFRISERLGAGAMGVVYRATQLSIGRDVAIKVMTGMDGTAVKRFFREAQIASALSHPNTVQIIEFGQSGDGRVYLAMELVRGRTLLDEIDDQGALPSRRICRIGTQLCDALEAAHRQTIVHRDLKPENVMIAVDGTDHVKILDFGIARVLGDERSRVTSAGLSAGTPHYMAPEVLGGGAEPEPPGDMYALGVILAELALGRRVWAKTTLEMLYVEKTANTAFDPVPPRLRPLVKRLVDADPAQRPTAAQARKMLRELDRTATDPVGIAPTLHPMSALQSKSATEHVANRSADPPLELPPMLDLEVIDLADRGGTPPLDAKAPAIKTPIEPLRPDTVNLAPSEDKLELEGSWKHERAARVAGKVAPSPLAARLAAENHAARRHNAGLWVAVAVLAVILGGGAYMYKRASETKASSPSAPDPENTVPARGVTIHIVGGAGTKITVDGAAAGKTPVSLERRPSKRTLTIGANGKTFRIVPDHNQTIDVSK